MTIYNIYEAKTNLSKIIELVQSGEKVVIAKNGKPVADLTQHVPSDDKAKRAAAYGFLKGKIKYNPASTDDNIDPEIQEMFYGKDWDKS